MNIHSYIYYIYINIFTYTYICTYVFMNSTNIGSTSLQHRLNMGDKRVKDFLPKTSKHSMHPLRFHRISPTQTIAGKIRPPKNGHTLYRKRRKPCMYAIFSGMYAHFCPINHQHGPDMGPKWPNLGPT